MSGDLERLRELAQAARPVHDSWWTEDECVEFFGRHNPEDCAYYAALDPETVLSLLAVVAAQREALEQIALGPVLLALEARDVARAALDAEGVSERDAV